MIDNLQHPFKGHCELWLRKIKGALEVKKRRFQDAADEAMRFYAGSHDFMWKEDYAQGKGGFLDKDSGGGGLPTFRMTVNKPFEAVALFGPALFFKYPDITVDPVRMPEIHPEALGINRMDEMGMQGFMQAMMAEDQMARVKETHSNIKQHYLNWLQFESNKKGEAREAITEAIVKGLGYLWVEMYQPKGSQIKYPRSFHVSCDDVVKDPDAKYNRDVQWVARKCCHPVNLVEEKYGFRPGELKGTMMSKAAQASTTKVKRARQGGRKAESSYDTLEYWEIYSKNGFGDRLKRATGEQTTVADNGMNWDWLGDFTYIVVAENIPFPLNMPSWSLAEGKDALFQRAQWPIPFWTDENCSNGWPFAELSFYDTPGSVWPMGMFKPCIGELRFVNWCMSFLADKVATSSTDYLLIMKSAGEMIQEQLLGGHGPYKMIELPEILGKEPEKLATFLTAPSFSIDIWKMVAEVMEMIDKRTGLTELIYGLTGTQIRSATEADIRNENVAVRPDEMASRTEDWLGTSAMKEMEAACWLLEPQDVAPVLGGLGTKIWAEQIQTTDFDAVVRDFSYRVVAGSARKPNKNNKVRQLNELGKSIGSTIQGLALGGMFEPWNAYIADVADALDLDPERYIIRPPAPEEQGPSEEEQELQHNEESHDQDVRHKEELHDVEMRNLLQRGDLDVDIARRKAAAAAKKPSSNGSSK